MSAASGGAAAEPGPTAAGQADRHLEHLYALSDAMTRVMKLFANFENVEDTFDPALKIAAESLHLRSAILMQAEGDRSKMIIWSSEGQSPEQLSAARANVEAAYTYFVGRPPSDPSQSEQAGKTPLPRQAEPEAPGSSRFVVIPLVVAKHRPFGALQLEGARRLDKTDLMFINAIANQLSVALDRDQAWRRDIVRGEQAEERRVHAERRGAQAEHDLVMSDSARNEFQALAEENASLYLKAKQAIGVREQLLAIVSHDLRTPLSTILLVAGMLREPPLGGERRLGLSAAVAKVERAASRMQRLIEDLLDFASIEAGNLAIKREPHPPGPILTETVSSFENDAQVRSLKLAAEIAPKLPSCSCDRDRVLQVFSNLVSNAIKVTQPGGQITLRVVQEGAELLFSVTDTGPGISEAESKHLFERYWRSDTATYKGTGLGLSIAQGIVVAHGGRIWVESALGRGTTFYFTIPAFSVTV